MRDVKLGRKSRVLLRVLLQEKISVARGMMFIAEQNQSMMDYKLAVNYEHRLNRILKSLEMAS